MGCRKKLIPMPAVGLNRLCHSALRWEESSLFHTTQAEESVSEAPKPSICWYFVESLTVITKPEELLALVKTTLACGCSSIERSPVVSITFTLGPYTGDDDACSCRLKHEVHAASGSARSRIENRKGRGTVAPLTLN